MTSNTHQRYHRCIPRAVCPDHRSGSSFVESMRSWLYAALLIGLIVGGGSLMYQLLLKELAG